MLSYEGEVLNGNLIGKAKGGFYENGNLWFEGEYFNYTRNGKGKEYYENGTLKFEGEYKYKNWMITGKEYYENDKLKLEGDKIIKGDNIPMNVK